MIKQIRCADCNKALIECAVANSNQTGFYKYIATCPFCGSESLPITFESKVRIAGIREGTRHKTQVANIELGKNDTWVVSVIESLI